MAGADGQGGRKEKREGNQEGAGVLKNSGEVDDPWTVFSYEVQMYWGMIASREALARGGQIKISNLGPFPQTIILNALLESKLLHTRILCELILETSNKLDDIKLTDLNPEWKQNKKLSLAVEELRSSYGKSGAENMPAWEVNKMMAHATKHRGSEYSYEDFFKKVDPPLKSCLLLIAELSGKDELASLIWTVKK